jgi:hypothetical protein
MAGKKGCYSGYQERYKGGALAGPAEWHKAKIDRHASRPIEVNLEAGSTKGVPLNRAKTLKDFFTCGLDLFPFSLKMFVCDLVSGRNEEKDTSIP